MMKNLLDNWKTTGAGLLTIASSIIRLIFVVRSGNADEATWTAAIGGVLAGIGLLAAGDASKSKQELAKVDTKVDQTAHAVMTGDTSILPKPTETPPPPKV